MNEPGVDILKGEIIFLEIKNNLSVFEALNQSFKYLIDLRSLFLDKNTKIHFLIILRGKFKMSIINSMN